MLSIYSDCAGLLFCQVMGDGCQNGEGSGEESAGLLAKRRRSSLSLKHPPMLSLPTGPLPKANSIIIPKLYAFLPATVEC